MNYQNCVGYFHGCLTLTGLTNAWNYEYEEQRERVEKILNKYSRPKNGAVFVFGGDCGIFLKRTHATW